MSYPLSALHIIIEEALHTEYSSSGSTVPAGTSSWISKAITEARKFSGLVIIEAALANNTESLAILVQTAQAGCTALANRLASYRQHTGEENHNLEKNGDLDKLEDILISNLDWLQQYFPVSFNNEAAVPVKKLHSEINRLSAGLIEAGKDETASDEAKKILATINDRMLLRQKGSLSYRQLSYLDTICNDVKKSGNTQPGNLFSEVIELLIRHNYNDPAIVRMVTEELYTLVNTGCPRQHQLDKWNALLTSCQLIETSGLYFDQGNQSVKKSVSISIQMAILALHHQEHNLFGSIHNTPAAGQLNKNDRVLTGLSVSQLAVFCRLLSDSKIIQPTNQTEWLRIVAATCHTTKTNAISPDSLRAKWYNPEKAAINILTEYLHGMLKQLKHY